MSANYQMVFRNYRFVIGALTLLMFILLLRSSATSMTIPDIKTPNLSTSVGNSNTVVGPATDSLVSGEKSGEPASSKGSAKPSKEVCQEEKYVIMIDAGSTGSRVHIYKFDTCSTVPKLVDETFQMLQPGLSSFGADTLGAAKSLDPLLEKALEVIPTKLRGCSPIAVKATAGLRFLGEEKSSKIIAAVRSHLEKNYPFPVVEGDGVSIMSGAEEGVYAWITTNYLLGNIGLPEKRSTAAIFDLGGGSTQIVFEPSFKDEEEFLDGEHKYVLNFGKHTYKLYQHSHLGYGLMQARDKINALIVQEAIDNKEFDASDVSTVHTLFSPCIASNSKLSDVKVNLGSKEYTINFQGPSSPAGSQCRFLAEKILHKEADCKVSPCSFNSVYQPSLVHTLNNSNSLYVFSFFYERTYPLGLPLSYQLEEMTELARVACSDEGTWKTMFSTITGALKSLKEQPNWCMDLSYQVALLHTGYDIPLHRELTTAAKIEGKEIGWCLGAALPLVMSEKWTCKVNEIN